MQRHEYRLRDDQLRSYRETIPLGIAFAVLLAVLGYNSGLPIEGGHAIAAIVNGVVFGILFACVIPRRRRSTTS